MRWWRGDGLAQRGNGAAENAAGERRADGAAVRSAKECRGEGAVRRQRRGEREMRSGCCGTGASASPSTSHTWRSEWCDDGGGEASEQRGKGASQNGAGAARGWSGVMVALQSGTVLATPLVFSSPLPPPAPLFVALARHRVLVSG
eukprot:gene14250-biopygen4887